MSSESSDDFFTLLLTESVNCVIIVLTETVNTNAGDVIGKVFGATARKTEDNR